MPPSRQGCAHAVGTTSESPAANMSSFVHAAGHIARSHSAPVVNPNQPSRVSANRSLSPATPQPSPLRQVQFEHYDPQDATSGCAKRLQETRHDVLTSGQGPNSVVQNYQNDGAVGVFLEFGRQQIIRRRKSRAQLEATARTREIGACETCSRLKHKCEYENGLYSPCIKCSKKMSTPAKSRTKGKLIIQPCPRINILDLPLHRIGPTANDKVRQWISRNNYQHEMAIGCLTPPSSNLMNIALTQGLGGLVLQVPVRSFNPRCDSSEDQVDYLWRDIDGAPKSYELLPYYICDIDKAISGMKIYIHQVTLVCPRELLTDCDDITKGTFQAAYNFMLKQPLSLVAKSLYLWTATRITEKTWRFVNPEALGMQPPQEEHNPWRGFVPVTPVMDTQLDFAAIDGFLNPTRQSLLQKLEKKINANDGRDLWEIYLSLFVLLNNFERAFVDIVEYTSRHGIPERTTCSGQSISKGYVHACKSLLSRFHFTYRSSRPVALIKKDGTIAERFYQAAPEHANYFRYVSEHLRRKDSHLSTTDLGDWTRTSMYDTPGYWSAQMFLDGWRGDIEHVTPVDDYTEKDLMTS